MGPEPLLGALAWLGVALAALAVAYAARKRDWIALLIFTTPGVLLGVEGAQGQVGMTRSLGVFMAFFAIGALLVGAPLAALFLRWSQRKSPSRGPQL
jgi:hypothetical protein